MEINITGRNTELNDAIREYIYRKLDKLGRVYSRIYKFDVILEEEKIRKNAEIILYLRRNRIVAKESSPDMYASIDNAVESIKKQLRRLTGRVRAKRRKSMLKNIMKPIMRFRGGDEAFFAEEYQSIIKTDLYADKPMLPEEAKLELQAMKMEFIMFKNADTGEPNVMFKRTDGSYGLIEPRF